MVNMKMSAQEAKEYSEPSASDAPEYPYGLCIDLNEESLAKLGITQLPAVGAQMEITARCVVTRTSSHDTQGGEPESSVSLQITDMDIEASSGSRDAASLLYGD